MCSNYWVGIKKQKQYAQPMRMQYLNIIHILKKNMWSAACVMQYLNIIHILKKNLWSAARMHARTYLMFMANHSTTRGTAAHNFFFFQMLKLCNVCWYHIIIHMFTTPSLYEIKQLKEGFNTLIVHGLMLLY